MDLYLSTTLGETHDAGWKDPELSYASGIYAGPCAAVRAGSALEGDTIYQKFIDQHGEGLQHLGVFAHDFDESLRKAEAAGYRVIQSGHGFGPDGDGSYAYLSTEEVSGTIFELIDRRPGGTRRSTSIRRRSSEVRAGAGCN